MDRFKKTRLVEAHQAERRGRHLVEKLFGAGLGGESGKLKVFRLYLP
ncbi:MAG: hypothetical protein M3R02_12245 [Chloroflexota bacterium]|nr:hypothetical protein [Chloroflexota bacterium]